ncbi:MAG: SEC-C domain-containing protein [Bdellovibrionales bacterium]|nr:SEC-C domain-containing protein [Bdellovibrionales bacterium]
MTTENEYKNVGRNDACPCASGKKFKRCHGENVPWQGNTVSRNDAESGSEENSTGPQFDPSKMDLTWLAEFSSAIQRLPKGQLQQLQAIMQKGMQGKDVARELDELQRRLPPSVQELLRKSPEIEKQLEAASGGASEGASLTDEQKSKLAEIQKNNEKSGLSKLWNRFRKK